MNITPHYQVTLAGRDKYKSDGGGGAQVRVGGKRPRAAIGDDEEGLRRPGGALKQEVPQAVEGTGKSKKKIKKEKREKRAQDKLKGDRARQAGQAGQAGQAEQGSMGLELWSPDQGLRADEVSALRASRSPPNAEQALASPRQETLR